MERVEMSHFTTLVVGDDYEAQLKPFSEELEVPEYEKPCYCITSNERNITAEILNFGKLRDWKEKYLKGTDEANGKLFSDLWDKYREADELAQQIVDNLKLGKPDPKCEDCKGTGIDHSTYNPKSKWDWYSVGGRWAGSFILKSGVVITPDMRGEKSWGHGESDPYIGGKVDRARKGDIDWEAMKAEALKEVEEDWARYEKDQRSFWDLPEGLTRDEFMAKKGKNDFATFAVLMDGEWYEKGKMGWWAMVSDEKAETEWEAEFTKLLEKIPDDTMLTVVDCHI